MKYTTMNKANTHEDEMIQVLSDMVKHQKYRSRIHGCLTGGAVGDALGYPVEFLDEDQIRAEYGTAGVRTVQKVDGEVRISDDTQMTLFTAAGILNGDTARRMNQDYRSIRHHVAEAYQDWFYTQYHDPVDGIEGTTWLTFLPEFYHMRAPGATCLSALANYEAKEDFIEAHVNNSKGCGGVMRVAPLALYYRIGDTYHGTIKALAMEGAQLAAITHGHSLGYMPAAVLTYILARILMTDGQVSLRDITREARDTAAEMFRDDPHIGTLTDIIDLAMELSQNKLPDVDNIHKIGGGWVAEETLGIAIYCALRYQNDFTGGVLAAIGHRGDSDSTGAVTGNILGAWLGIEAIDCTWTRDLELNDAIQELADDLCFACPISEYSDYRDPYWEIKYIERRLVFDDDEEDIRDRFGNSKWYSLIRLQRSIKEDMDSLS